MPGVLLLIGLGPRTLFVVATFSRPPALPYFEGGWDGAATGTHVWVPHISKVGGRERVVIPGTYNSITTNS